MIYNLCSLDVRSMQAARALVTNAPNRSLFENLVSHKNYHILVPADTGILHGYESTAGSLVSVIFFITMRGHRRALYLLQRVYK